MANISHTDILRKIDKKIFDPIYFLQGEEPYFIDVIADYIEENALEASEKDFNQTIVYGKDIKGDELFAMAKGFPMMANYQVIIVREAQDIRPPEQFLEQLALYLEHPVKTTILVICYKYKKIDSRRKAAKAIATIGTLFESAKVYENQIPRWIQGYVSDHGCRIGDKAALMLTEFIGPNLSRQANELNKLFILTAKGEEITPDSIEKNIGISKDYNMFELYKSLGNRNHANTFKIASYFGHNAKENPPIKVIIMLFSFFNKLLIYHSLDSKSNDVVAKELGISPYGIQDYRTAAEKYTAKQTTDVLSILRTYDLMAKGVDAAAMPDDQLMMELIIKVAYA